MQTNCIPILRRNTILLSRVTEQKKEEEEDSARDRRIKEKMKKTTETDKIKRKANKYRKKEDVFYA